MRRAIRLTGTLLVLAGLGLLTWSLVVWRWQDPVTSIYTHLEQRELERNFQQLVTAGPAEDARPLDVAEEATRFRQSLQVGDAVGRLRIPRLGLTTIIVEGTDTQTLKRGPGRYRDLFLPGQGELVYVAGHRTTYAAPFARIDQLRPGDEVTVEVPYGSFVYRVVDHRIVREDDVSVLESNGTELLALQACHPRFFATHRYIAYAEPVDVTPRAAVAAGGEEGAPAP